MTTSPQPPRVDVDAAALDAYQAEAMARSSQSREPKPMAYRFFYGASSLAGEAGELFGVIKKAAFHGRPVDLEKLNDEAGDVLWYCAYLADSIGATLGECVEAGAPVDPADWFAVSEVRPEAVRNGIVLVPAAIFSRVMAVAGEILIIGSESTHDEFRRDVGRVVALVAHGLAWCGLSLTAAMVANQAKLAARYPAGYSLADYAAKEEGRAPAGSAP
jgi:NTP pyrophosphatase (non-canonical NTP hydrolase)